MKWKSENESKLREKHPSARLHKNTQNTLSSQSDTQRVTHTHVQEPEYTQTHAQTHTHTVPHTQGK